MKERVLWLALAASLLPSLALILCVARGWADGIDRRLLLALQPRRSPAPGARPSRLHTAARDLTALGGDTLRLLFLAACMIGLIADRRAAIAWQLLAIFASARLALVALKALVRRPRPDLVAPGVTTFTTSFPSGHTLMAAALFLAAALLVPAQEPAAVRAAAIGLALAISLMIAATRLALGIHWPSDIVVGWLGGVGWAIGGALAVAALAG